MPFNPTMRVALESAGNEEAKAVLTEIRKIESAELSRADKERAVKALSLGVGAWREDKARYHASELDKLEARYKRDEERRAPA